MTSPPYWQLRDYNISGQYGLEKTPQKYIARQVEVFREARRVLRDDGTLWVNIGDSYASGPKNRSVKQATEKTTLTGSTNTQCQILQQSTKVVSGLKPKDLVGIPWMLAFALREDGWYLRSDIIWAKKNCMPESVTDRPTRSHEYIFLLSKSAKYYYDHEAIKEPAIYDVDGTGTAARKARQKETEVTAGVRPSGFKDATKMNGKHGGVYEDSPGAKIRSSGERQPGFKSWDLMTKSQQCVGMRNKRDVWHVSPAQFPEAHFATFPPALITDCIKAGCPEGGVVLDPYMGAGTTALVARKLNRNYIGVELNPEYIKIAQKRLTKELGMFV